MNQLETETFIQDIMDNKVPADKKTLRKFLKLFDDMKHEWILLDNIADALRIFLFNYRFKSLKDYVSVLDMLKSQGYFNLGVTVYTKHSEVITDVLFKSVSLKDEWIIEHMAKDGSFYEINVVTAYFFDSSNIDFDTIDKVIDTIDVYKNAPVFYEAIIRHTLSRNDDKLVAIYKHMFSKNIPVETHSIEIRFNDIKNKELKGIVSEYIYRKTKNEKYLPKDAIDIFVF